MTSSSRDPARASLRADSNNNDDGVDPRLVLRRSKHPQRKPNHHSQQYGKGAGRAVEQALFSLSDDPAIQSLMVISAELTGAVLTVTLQASSVMTWPDLVALEAGVQALAPSLRAVLAAEFQRKRTPHVRLRLIPAVAAG